MSKYYETPWDAVATLEGSTFKLTPASSPEGINIQKMGVLNKYQFLDVWRKYCSVSKIKAELAMEEAGVYDQVMLALSTSTNKKLKIAYNATTEIPRTSPYVDLMADKLGMTDEEIDSLFYLAESIDLTS
jgi:hypothetical protein